MRRVALPLGSMGFIPIACTSASCSSVETLDTGGIVATLRGTVYSSLTPGFPHLAIILREDDEVLLCRAVGSVAEGQEVIEVITRGLNQVAALSAREPDGRTGYGLTF